MLLELGVAAYLKKPAYVVSGTGDPKLGRDLRLTVIRGDVHQIPKVLFGYSNQDQGPSGNRAGLLSS
jgi:hypothetical protein